MRPVEVSKTGDRILVKRSSWQRDLLKGFFYALLIVVSLLFFSGAASHFIYVDF